MVPGGEGGTVSTDCAEQLVKKGSVSDFGKNNAKAIIAKVNEAQAKFGGDAALMLAQLQRESGFNPKAVSSANAQGIAQFIPGTWVTQGQDGNGNGKNDPFEWEDGIYAQAAYNKYIKNFLGSTLGTTENIVAAYNAGEGAIKDYGGWEKLPPKYYGETFNYVKIIVYGLYPKYKKCLSGGGAGVSAPTGSAQELAQKILNHPNVIFTNADRSGDKKAYALQNIKDTADGKPGWTSQRSDVGQKQVNLAPQLLSGILKAADAGYKVEINFILGGDHSEGSRHYIGKAVDVNYRGHPDDVFQKMKSIMGAERSLNEGDHYHFGWP